MVSQASSTKLCTLVIDWANFSRLTIFGKLWRLDFGHQPLLATICLGAQKSPHNTFLKKHDCPGRALAASSLISSQLRNRSPGLSKTSVITFFFRGSGNSLDRKKRCITRVGMAAFSCHLKTKRSPWEITAKPVPPPPNWTLVPQ